MGGARDNAWAHLIPGNQRHSCYNSGHESRKGLEVGKYAPAEVLSPMSGSTRIVRYPLVVGAVLATFLLTFVIAQSASLPLLTDVQPHLDERSWVTALLGVGLLVSDVVLPIPSSVVMVAQGAVFGLVAGALLALLGGTGATMAAYLVGRRGRRTVHRLVSPSEQQRAAALMDRHGIWAVVITRPVPMLAETVAIFAGVERLPWPGVMLAAAVGNLVPALAYAAVGAFAASFVNGLIVFAGVSLLALVVGLMKRRIAA
jgi:uncharacterized membrane protein YdjX (TVP38/TMEM64 family)